MSIVATNLTGSFIDYHMSRHADVVHLKQNFYNCIYIVVNNLFLTKSKSYHSTFISTNVTSSNIDYHVSGKMLRTLRMYQDPH